MLIGIMLLLGRGAPAWHEWEHAQTLAAQESSLRLLRAQSAMDSRRVIIAMRSKLTAQLDALTEACVHATSATVAGAALATLMGDWGTESGIRITSTSVRADTARKVVFTRIAVRISATGDVEGLAEFLRAIESSDQLLALRELSIVQSDPSAPDSRAESLRFEIVVEGLAQIEAKERDATVVRQ